MTAEFSEIPVLDVSAIHGTDANAKQGLARRFLDVYGQTGFGYITGHGIDADLVTRVFDASARFHALPRSEKFKIKLDHLHRGFIAIDTSTDVNSTLAEVTKPNQSESFMMMREADASDPDVMAGAYLAGPNQWPDLPGFRDDVMAYNAALSSLGQKLIEIAALAIDADPADLLPAFERPTTWLRLLYYPPTRAMNEADLYGSAPHTDFGCLTILAQDQVGGLQVMTPAGAWVDAPYIAGSFVLNVGDMLHRWSNGRLRSTPHRVINRSGRARYSCPFFFDPNVATEIAPLACCVQDDAPPKFPPVQFGAFLRAELEASYEQHQDQDQQA